MFKNYLKIALRNLVKSKTSSLIKVAGLAIGMSCCILILLFVRDELRFDRHHANAEHIYRLINERHTDDGFSYVALTPPPLGPALERAFPEVEKMLRLFPLRFQPTLLSHGEKKYFEEYLYLAEPSIFDFFHLPFKAGNPQTALGEPNAVVLTEKMAQKYFGDDNPVGETLTMSNRTELQVTGVIENPDEHFHLKMDFIISFATLKAWGVPQERMASWQWQQFYNYVMLPEGYDPALLESKLADFMAEHADPETRANGFWFKTRLQPVTDIHLHSADFRFDFSEKGDIDYVYAFSIIAVFILLIACINFMNLSTARSAGRAREVGLRKVIGAKRSQLVKQFLGESMVMAIIAVLIAIGMVELMLPAFNTFSGKHLALNFSSNLMALSGVLGFGLVVGLLAGSYPAFFLSAFRPLNALRGESGANRSGFPLLRRVLVVFQFAISIMLIAATAIVFRQIDFVQTRNLGFDKEQIVILPMRGSQMRQNYETIKNELLRNPGVISATACYGIPGGVVAGDAIRLAGEPNNRPANVFIVDYDYIRTLRMELVAGRGFSRDFRTDGQSSFILNETMVKEFGWRSPQQAIGKELEWDMWGQDGVKKGKVIGVVKDFHLKSLHEKIAPVVMHIYPSAFASIVVRIRPESISTTIKFLRQKWHELAPDWPFEYTFLDQTFAQLYTSERKLGEIILLFSCLSIFVACLGLFGLASYLAERGRKEIGIRKVLGATVTSVVALLSKDFVKLVLVANLIAWPVAWYAMQKWLQNFAYRIEISWWVFALAGGLALLIALLTVSTQAIRAALANPVESLRYE